METKLEKLPLQGVLVEVCSSVEMENKEEASTTLCSRPRSQKIPVTSAQQSTDNSVYHYPTSSKVRWTKRKLITWMISGPMNSGSNNVLKIDHLIVKLRR